MCTYFQTAINNEYQTVDFHDSGELLGKIRLNHLTFVQNANMNENTIVPIDGDLKGYLSGRSTRTFQTPPSYGAEIVHTTQKKCNSYAENAKFTEYIMSYYYPPFHLFIYLFSIKIVHIVHKNTKEKKLMK